MSYTNSRAISELSDTDLDAVAAGTGTGWGSSYHFGQIAAGNIAVQLAANNQLNVAGVNFLSGQGGNQSNNNNAGNQR